MKISQLISLVEIEFKGESHHWQRHERDGMQKTIIQNYQGRRSSFSRKNYFLVSVDFIVD
jgi:hypothetical protein